MKIVQTISILFLLACDFGAARRLRDPSAGRESDANALTNHHRDLQADGKANRCEDIIIKIIPGEATDFETQGLVTVASSDAWEVGKNGEVSSKPIGNLDWLWFKTGRVNFHIGDLQLNKNTGISFSTSGNGARRGGITGGSGRYKGATGEVLINGGEGPNGQMPEWFEFRVSCDGSG